MPTDPDSRLRRCFAIVFPDVPLDDLSAMQRGQDNQWDSLASISLVSVVEEEFEVAFDDRTLDLLTSFEAFRAAVAEA